MGGYRRRSIEAGVLSAGIVALLSACGEATTTSTTSQATAPGFTTSTSGSGAGSGTTSLTVGGALSGALVSKGAACVDQGLAGFQIAIQGTLGGATYVLKFDAPKGTTDLSVATTADITVFFGQIPAGPTWGADPRAKNGSGTLVVNGSTGGTVNIHLTVPAGSSATAPLDVSGTYTCSSNLTA